MTPIRTIFNLFAAIFIVASLGTVRAAFPFGQQIGNITIGLAPKVNASDLSVNGSAGFTLTQVNGSSSEGYFLIDSVKEINNETGAVLQTFSKPQAISVNASTFTVNLTNANVSHPDALMLSLFGDVSNLTVKANYTIFLQSYIPSDPSNLLSFNFSVIRQKSGNTARSSINNITLTMTNYTAEFGFKNQSASNITVIYPEAVGSADNSYAYVMANATIPADGEGGNFNGTVQITKNPNAGAHLVPKLALVVASVASILAYTL